MHITCNTTLTSNQRREPEDVLRSNKREEHFPFRGHRFSASEGNVFKESYAFSTATSKCEVEATAAETRSNLILELKVRIRELDAKIRNTFAEAAALYLGDTDCDRQEYQIKVAECIALYENILRSEKALRRLERGRTIEQAFQSGTRFRNAIKGIAKLAFTSRNLPPQPRAMEFCEVAAAEAESRSDQHL